MRFNNEPIFVSEVSLLSEISGTLLTKSYLVRYSVLLWIKNSSWDVELTLVWSLTYNLKRLSFWHPYWVLTPQNYHSISHHLIPSLPHLKSVYYFNLYQVKWSFVLVFVIFLQIVKSHFLISLFLWWWLDSNPGQVNDFH